MNNLHQATIDWLANKLPNAVENHRGRQLDFDGRYPDVVVLDNDRQPLELHEVESCRKRELPNWNLKRVLWLLTVGHWEEVNVIFVPPFEELNVEKMFFLRSQLIEEIASLKATLKEETASLKATLKEETASLKATLKRLENKVQKKRKEYINLYFLHK